MIIFGTKDREEPRGIVAEHCGGCNSIRLFEVVDHYEVGHVYFVSIGQGQRKGTAIKCLQCRKQFQFRAERYPVILPTSALGMATFDEIVAQTNPSLLPHPVERPHPPQQASPPNPAADAVVHPTFYRCGACGCTRDFPFKFCPQCRARRAT